MKNLTLLLLLSFCSVFASAQADSLRIPVGSQGSAHHLSMPQRGQSQQLVLNTWGQPLKRHAAVGQPPISRWDYLEFSVYFEHNHVINSVRQHHPRRPQP